MRKQFAKKSIAAAVATAALTLAAIAPVGAADPSDDWFERQRSVTDGVSAEIQRDAAPKGARSRVGEPLVSLEQAGSNREDSEQAGSNQEEWLIQQLRKTEGSSE